MGTAGLTLQLGGAQQYQSALAQIDAILGHIDQKLNKDAAAFDRFNASLERLGSGATRSFSTILSGNLSTQIDNLGNSLQSAGRALAQSGLMELSLVGLPAFFGSRIVQTAADFDQVLKQIELINSALDATFGKAKMDQIIAGINDFAQRTIFTSSEAARAFLQIQKSGFDAADALRILNDAGNLAAADGMIGLEKAQFGVIQAMKLFNLTGADTTRIIDSLKRSADASQASSDDLIEGLGNLGPVAAEFGLSLEQTLAVLSLFNDRGVRGAEAGTQLRSMLSNMIRPTEAVKGALSELGISLQDAQGNFKDIDAIIGEFQTKTANLTEYQKVQALRTIAGAWGQIGLSILTGLDPNPVQKFINTANGLPDTATTAANMMKTFKGAMENLRGSVENLLNTALRPLLEDVLAPMVTKLVEVVNAISRLPQPILSAVAATAALVTAFLTLSAVGKILRGLFMLMGGKTLVGFAGSLKAITTLLFNPVGLIAGFVQLAAVAAPVLVVIGAIIAGLEALNPIFEQISKKGSDLNYVFQLIMTDLGLVARTISDGVKAVGDNLKFVWETLRSRVKTIGPSIKTVERFFYGVRDAILTVNDTLDNFFDWLTSRKITNVGGQTYLLEDSPLTKFIAGAIQSFREFRDIAVDLWTNYVEPVIADIGNRLSDTWNILKTIDPEAIFNALGLIGKGIGLIAGGFSAASLVGLSATYNILPTLAQAFKDLVDALSALSTGDGQAASEAFKKFLGDIIALPFEAAEGAINEIIRLINTITGSDFAPISFDLSSMQTLVNGLVDLGAKVLSSQIGKTLQDFVKNIKEAIDILAQIPQGDIEASLGILGLVGGIAVIIPTTGLINGISQALSPLAKAIRDLAAAASDAVEGDTSGAINSIGSALFNLGVAAGSIPLGIADKIFDFLRDVTGLNLPSASEGLRAFGEALGLLGNIIEYAADQFVTKLQRSFTILADSIAFAIVDALSRLPGSLGESFAPERDRLAQEIATQVAGRDMQELLARYIGGEQVDLAKFFTFTLNGEDVQINPDQLAQSLSKIESDRILTALQAAVDSGDLGTIDLLLPVVLSPFFDSRARDQVIADIQEKLKVENLDEVAGSDFAQALTLALKFQLVLPEGTPERLRDQMLQALQNLDVGAFEDLFASIDLVPASAEFTQTLRNWIMGAFDNALATANSADIQRLLELGDIIGVDPADMKLKIENALSAAMANGNADLAKAVSEALGEIDPDLKFKIDNWTKYGSDAADEVSKGLQAGVEEQSEGITKSGMKLGEAFKSGLEESLEIASPSKWATQVGIYTGQGLYDGLEFTRPLIDLAIQNIIGMFMNMGTTIMNTLVTTQSSIVTIIPMVIPQLQLMTSTVNTLALAWNSAGMQATAAAAAFQRAALITPPQREARNPLGGGSERLPYRGMRDQGGEVGRGRYGIGVPEMLFASGRAYLLSPGKGFIQPIQNSSSNTVYDQSVDYGGLTFVLPPGAQNDPALVTKLDNWWENKKRSEAPGLNLSKQGKR